MNHLYNKHNLSLASGITRLRQQLAFGIARLRHHSPPAEYPITTKKASSIRESLLRKNDISI